MVNIREVFSVTFWDDIKVTSISSIRQTKERKKLSISQRQEKIKSIEKRTAIKETLKIGDLFHY